MIFLTSLRHGAMRSGAIILRFMTSPILLQIMGRTVTPQGFASPADGCLCGRPRARYSPFEAGLSGGRRGKGKREEFMKTMNRGTFLAVMAVAAVLGGGAPLMAYVFQGDPAATGKGSPNWG